MNHSMAIQTINLQIQHCKSRLEEDRDRLDTVHSDAAELIQLIENNETRIEQLRATRDYLASQQGAIGENTNE